MLVEFLGGAQLFMSESFQLMALEKNGFFSTTPFPPRFDISDYLFTPKTHNLEPLAEYIRQLGNLVNLCPGLARRDKHEAGCSMDTNSRPEVNFMELPEHT